jgi:serine/threonine-protein kinase
MNKELSDNTMLSHFRIVSKLGAGGMGEVYLAEDTRLDRKVALKLLPAEFTQDEDRVQRFIQEAKAASALNHPNIITIHEIGQAEGAHFMATEFIDGHTLRQHVASGKLTLQAALEIAIQTASALVAAHEAGIVHRDIKPENVMLRRDGILKVLDFGLAKLTERQTPAAIDVDAATRAKVITEPGAVMGTPQYMSPEQARGQKVDQRTDIFSLGVVLYEMIAGRSPFDGVNALDVISAILQKEPQPLTTQATEPPSELQRIVSKTLRKNRDERYQTARDLLNDLKDLKEELSFAAKHVRAGQTERNQTVTVLADAVPTDARAALPTTSSAKIILGEIKRHKLGLALTLGLLLAAVAALSYFVLLARPDSGPIDSLAVLPFQNRSAGADSEYLSDGLAESLIYRLSQLPHLKVSPTSSVFRYKGKETDPQTIGRELGVDAVMTGRIAQRGENLTISVELVDVRNHQTLWGEQYERRLSELLATQREIAAEITNKLQLKLSGTDQTKVAKNYTANPEAYQLYLKGRFYWNKRGEENLRKAIEQFKAATEKDPHFALAYVGLADSLSVLLYYTRASESEVISQAKAYAERALEIDASLAETHASLGLINRYSWQWAEAEKELKRAIELNPNYATARHWYSRHLRTLGRYTEALAQIKQAHEADPLSLVISVNLAESLVEHGDLNGAIEQCRLIIELDPNFWAAYENLAFAYLKLGRKDEALTQAQKAVELSNRAIVSLKSLGYVQAMAGKRNEALAVVRELEERYAKQQADGRDIAVVYAGLGEKDQAFAWLEKDFQARGSSLADIRLETAFDSLRDDSRYKDLARRIGLPELK